ncbi:MAG TPA: VOC family protein [Nitrolancea sp.]|nr:VOC family protein [Nitrolancea sp.]
MKINFLFAGVPVADYAAARVWYARFFGREPDYIVTENEAMWQIPNVGSIYVVGDAARAGRALVTLAVDDLEDLVARFTEQGLAMQLVDTSPDSPKRMVVTDPEGNQFTLFENSGSD